QPERRIDAAADGRARRLPPQTTQEVAGALRATGRLPRSLNPAWFECLPLILRFDHLPVMRATATAHTPPVLLRPGKARGAGTVGGLAPVGVALAGQHQRAVRMFLDELIVNA